MFSIPRPSGNTSDHSLAFSMSTQSRPHRSFGNQNCEVITRRDSIKLGLGGLVAVGLSGALQAPNALASISSSGW